jgi:hypothetical protein
LFHILLDFKSRAQYFLERRSFPSMEISFLATSSPERAVWLSYGFYVLNLLVPIIPAVIIYRLFPESRTAGNSVEGSVAGWKIKAVGAWGAYVTAFLLGLWTIKSTTVPLIKAGRGIGVDDRFRFSIRR